MTGDLETVENKESSSRGSGEPAFETHRERKYLRNVAR